MLSTLIELAGDILLVGADAGVDGDPVQTSSGGR
jgi:hypothetical protein